MKPFYNRAHQKRPCEEEKMGVDEPQQRFYNNKFSFSIAQYQYLHFDEANNEIE